MFEAIFHMDTKSTFLVFFFNMTGLNLTRLL